MSEADGARVAADGAIRMLGPIAIARGRTSCDVRSLFGTARHRDAVLLCLPRTTNHENGSAAGSGLLIDPNGGGRVSDCGGGVVLLVPGRLVRALGPDHTASGVVPASAALTMLQGIANRLIGLAAGLDAAQADLAGRALGEMVALALAPYPAGTAMASRREASLLDRVVAHIDDHLRDDLEAATLAAALNCSRSALYRAVGPLGGVTALVNQRRLAAVHDRLRDPGERRSIAAVAHDHGFADPAHFSRSFRQRYGTTAAALRRSAPAAATRRRS